MASNEEVAPVKSEQNNTLQGDSSAKTDKKPYEKSYLRVSKDTLYMIIALWIEDFVNEEPEKHKKVGAVLVLPNDVILAADCSRDEVHAVARLLIKHSDKAEGCKMFMSRKPCPFCAKLLVQSKVKRVLFLPTREPEYYRSPEEDTETDQSFGTTGAQPLPEDTPSTYNDKRMQEVETMFTASAIAQTKFAVRVEKSVLEKLRSNEDKGEDKEKVSRYKDELICKYDPNESSKWDQKAIRTKLPWPAYDDEIEKQVKKNFEDVMEWTARVLLVPERAPDEFIACNEISKKPKGFDPVNNPDDKKKAKHFMQIARLLAERTDDPKVGVGAVIVSQDMEVLSFGWNGFPLKAHYGEFARASKSDENALGQKYSYVIHAEQNALLMRNTKNVEGAILFLVNRFPCGECTPLIAMAGIKTVVTDDEVFPDNRENKALDYEKFPKMVKNDNFVCYQTKKISASPPPER